MPMSGLLRPQTIVTWSLNRPLNSHVVTATPQELQLSEVGGEAKGVATLLDALATGAQPSLSPSAMGSAGSLMATLSKPGGFGALRLTLWIISLLFIWCCASCSCTCRLLPCRCCVRSLVSLAPLAAGASGAGSWHSKCKHAAIRSARCSGLLSASRTHSIGQLPVRGLSFHTARSHLPAACYPLVLTCGWSLTS